MGSLYAGAYWSARPESIEECTVRLHAFLNGLTDISPMFNRWFERGRSRKSALREPIEIEPTRLQQLLLAGRSRGDFDDHPIIEELGFSFGAWNGEEPSVGVSVHCGMFPRATSIKNVVVLNLPAPEHVQPGVITSDFARSIVSLLAAVWDPDWATFSSDALREEQGATPGDTVIGYATYLRSSWRLAFPLLPRGCRSAKSHHGRVITIGDDPLAVDARAVTQLARRWNPRR